jgi:6-phosphofructokinase
MTIKRISILTGGGDVAVLSSVIKSVVYHGNQIDCRVESLGAARRSS